MTSYAAPSYSAPVHNTNESSYAAPVHSTYSAPVKIKNLPEVVHNHVHVTVSKDENPSNLNRLSDHICNNIFQSNTMHEHLHQLIVLRQSYQTGTLGDWNLGVTAATSEFNTHRIVEYT